MRTLVVSVHSPHLKTPPVAPAFHALRILPGSVRPGLRKRAELFRWTPYRRDLSVGLIVSMLVHAAIFWGGAWRTPSPQPRTAIQPEPLRLELLVWTEAEPEDAEPVGAEAGAALPDFAPPPRLQEPLVAALDPSAFVVPATRVSAPGAILARDALAVPLPGGRGAGARFTGIFELAELDQPPQVRSQTLPQYPPELERAGISGEALVRFVVDDQGVVRRASVLRASRTEFERPALRAVAGWRFRPGRKAGRPVATWMEVPIAFALPGRRTALHSD